jgi:hypothetical protein
VLLGFHVASGAVVYTFYPETAHAKLEQLGAIFDDSPAGVGIGLGLATPVIGTSHETLRAVEAEGKDDSVSESKPSVEGDTAELDYVDMVSIAM